MEATIRLVTHTDSIIITIVKEEVRTQVADIMAIVMVVHIVSLGAGRIAISYLE